MNTTTLLAETTSADLSTIERIVSMGGIVPILIGAVWLLWRAMSTLIERLIKAMQQDREGYVGALTSERAEHMDSLKALNQAHERRIKACEDAILECEKDRRELRDQFLIHLGKTGSSIPAKIASKG